METITKITQSSIIKLLLVVGFCKSSERHEDDRRTTEYSKHHVIVAAKVISKRNCKAAWAGAVTGLEKELAISVLNAHLVDLIHLGKRKSVTVTVVI